MMAHYAGDETIWPDEQVADNVIAGIAPPLGEALQSLWFDLPTADNQFHINLK